MEVANKSIQDGRFRGNILVVGKTACGKTYFLQKLGLSKLFGKLVKTEWVAGIEIVEQREAEIQSCFSKEVEFHLATEPYNLVSLTEKFKLRTRDITSNESNSVFGEKISVDRLIVTDHVSGIADNCKKFAEFLTVCRRYRYHSIYMFHIIMPESQIWKRIFSQTNIFNIFPSSVAYNTIAKILKINCRQTTKKYIPARSVWLNRLLLTLPTQMNDIA